ncbi:hypothetical protein bplSymb_SCF24401P002 [Bathymodiolus platifrons methanotrophic gill symbiont]|nr:hypothetical protein bplSymb_SCF24401P002 [Bathymodiolus platifrons methanotrophic gill symbiont]
MFDFSTAWLIQHKVLLPGVSTLSRLISEIRKRANSRLFIRLAALPNEEKKTKLKELLTIPEGMSTSKFDFLRRCPVTISGTSFNNAVSRYIEFKDFGIQSLNFKNIPIIRLNNIARNAGIASVYSISRMPEVF